MLILNLKNLKQIKILALKKKITLRASPDSLNQSKVNPHLQTDKPWGKIIFDIFQFKIKFQFDLLPQHARLTLSWQLLSYPKRLK